MRLGWRVLLAATLVALLGCGDETATGPEAEPPDPGLQLSDALVTGCYSWPAERFGPTNQTRVMTTLLQGDVAVEFTLRDGSGKPYTLSTLLETKPVLLVLGSHT